MAVRGDHLFEHACSSIDFLDDVISEQSLSEHSKSPMLALDSQFLCLEIDINVLEIIDSALFLCCGDDPAAELIVDIISAFAAIVFFTIDDESAFEVIGEILGTSLHSFLGSVDRPLDLFRLNTLNFFCLCLDTSGQLVVTTAVNLNISILLDLLVAAIMAALVTAVFVLVFLTCLAFSLFSSLVLLPFLGLIFQNEG